MDEYIYRKIRWQRQSKNVDSTVNRGNKRRTKNEEILNEKLLFWAVKYITIVAIKESDEQSQYDIRISNRLYSPWWTWAIYSCKIENCATLIRPYSKTVTNRRNSNVTLKLRHPHQNRKLLWKSADNPFIQEQRGWPSCWIVLENHGIAIKNWNSKLKI